MTDAILCALADGPRDLDELQTTTGEDRATLFRELVGLELCGLVRRLPGFERIGCVRLSRPRFERV